MEAIMGKCEHKFVHLETIKEESRWVPNTSGQYSPWKRIDRFFCEKCLEISEKRREEYSQKKPDWF